MARTSLPAIVLALAAGCSDSDSENTADSPDGGTMNADSGAGNGDSGGGAQGPCSPDESGPIPTRDQPGTWQRIEMPGGRCSDGSPYAIFVNYSDTSNNVMLMLEPGGACWDYASCSGNGGLRGAANPNGLKPDMQALGTFQFLPLMRKDVEKDVNPVNDWNMVFLPYCTGDIHTGNNTITYEGPAGEQLEFHHNGHGNVQEVIGWVSDHFTDIPKLLVTGCSAGGAGSIINYHFIRQGLGDAVQCGYMLDDSGPIFPSSGNSAPLHAKVRESWNVDPLLDSLEGEFGEITSDDIKRDFGLLNTALSHAYPSDRLSLTLFRRDLNYSLYSYESFYDFPEYTEIHRLWDEDVALLKEIYDSRDNLAYYLPYWRIDNCSHCVSIPPIGLDGTDVSSALTMPWLNSDIESRDINLRQFVEMLLDDTQPLESFIEEDQAEEGFSAEEAAECEEL